MAWMDAAWQYRSLVTIDCTKVGAGGVTNFPFLLTGANMPAGLFTNALASGADLRLTASDGTTEINFELVSFTPGSSLMELWGLGASVGSAVNWTGYLYWGNPAASAKAAAWGQGVWTAAGYSAVYHLPEDLAGATGAALYKDSSGLNTAGLDYVDATGKTGQIGSGQQFDGSNDYINAGTLGTFGANRGNGVNASFWVKSGGAAAIYTPFGVANAAAGARNGLLVRINDKSDGTVLAGSVLAAIASDEATPKGLNGATNANNIPVGSWAHVHVDWTPASNLIAVYVNGASKGITYGAQATPAVFGNFSNFMPLGAYNTGALSQFINGSLDEMRFALGVRAAAWPLTSYNNQFSPSTFYSMGAAEMDLILPVPRLLLAFAADQLRLGALPTQLQHGSLPDQLTLKADE